MCPCVPHPSHPSWSTRAIAAVAPGPPVLPSLCAPPGRAVVTSGLGSSGQHLQHHHPIPKARTPASGKAENPDSLGTEGPQRLPGQSFGDVKNPMILTPPNLWGLNVCLIDKQYCKEKIVLVNIYLSVTYSMYLNGLTVFSNRVCQQMDRLLVLNSSVLISKDLPAFHQMNSYLIKRGYMSCTT